MLGRWPAGPLTVQPLTAPPTHLAVKYPVLLPGRFSGSFWSGGPGVRRTFFRNLFFWEFVAVLSCCAVLHWGGKLFCSLVLAKMSIFLLGRLMLILLCNLSCLDAASPHKGAVWVWMGCNVWAKDFLEYFSSAFYFSRVRFSAVQLISAACAGLAACVWLQRPRCAESKNTL